MKILEYNIKNNIFFFRITSDLIPFASHPVMQFKWQDHFKSTFKNIGNFIKDYGMRITMHPGQYTFLNSHNEEVYRNAIKDLEYHVDLIDLMGLESTAKVQIHVGGVYGDKEKSIWRFVEKYNKLEDKIKKRLIIENDDRSYNLNDCLLISHQVKIPIVFDIYHHSCYNNGESLTEAFDSFIKTWHFEDGIPIVHYSSEHHIKGKSKHAEFIDLPHFKKFIKSTKNYDFDIMLEIKDKETSALKAIDIIKSDSRFNRN